MIRRGTYLLSVRLPGPRAIRVGALGEHLFEEGAYIYAGSAMGGLDQRLCRHLSERKKVRWHIDHLTTAGGSAEAFESYPDPVPECVLARIVEECGGVPEMRGFGCSDCRCATHLFRDPGGVLERAADRCSLSPFRPPGAGGSGRPRRPGRPRPRVPLATPR